MKFQKPKGTRDFYPEEMNARLAIFDRLRTIAKRYGFSEIESPAFESLKLLTAKSGSEILEQIFTLEKRGTGEEAFGLRFDITVPAARMFIEKQKELAKPVKWFYITRMWRYEAPQKGRLREFYQFGVELFGSDKPEADAECIALGIDCLLGLGLKAKDFVVKLNNRKLLQGLLYGLGIKQKIDEVIRVIDKKKKLSEKEFDLELKALELTDKQIKGIVKIVWIKDLSEIKETELNDEAKQGLEELKGALEMLKAYKKSKFVEIDLSVARGLAYYTGTVYECFDKREGLRSIFAGGRYDNMIEQFEGEPCAATGFAMGDAVLEILLRERGLWPKIDKGPDYYVVLVGPVQSKAIEIINKLRKKYLVDYDLIRRGITKQLDYANKIKAKKVIFIGEREIWSGKLTVKDMKTGKESKIKISDIVK